MSQFQFKLQRVYEIREQSVKECEAELQRLYDVRTRLKSLLEEQKEAYFLERDELNATLKKAEFFKIGMYENSLELRKSKMMMILAKIREFDSDIDHTEQILVQARKQFKIIETLKENQHLAFNKSEEEKERKFLDEQATLRYARRQGLDSKKGA